MSTKNGRKEKGAIFSLDAGIAFTLTLFSLLVFASALGNYSSQLISQENNIFLQEKTMMVADSLVKNYNAENSLLGACVIDADKKRTKSNELTFSNLANAKPFVVENFFVKKVSIPAKGFVKELDARQEAQCITVKRLVLVDGAKAIIEVEGCLG